MIFRPNNPITPTPLPNPVPVGDNILELNLTSESLAFSPSLGSVPNRGTDPQKDVFLNGVPYLQTINDVTNPGQSIGIHAEPGLWMIVPQTTLPDIKQSTVFRMGSIPHGTTIEAQGIFVTHPGPPNIEPVNITPFKIGNPADRIPFPSQKAADPNTPRITISAHGTRKALPQPTSAPGNNCSGASRFSRQTESMFMWTWWNTTEMGIRLPSSSAILVQMAHRILVAFPKIPRIFFPRFPGIRTWA
jgi:hypothetical protein